MKRIIAGATGLVGTAVTRHWIKGGHNVTAVGRSRAKIQSVFGATVKAVQWDELNRMDAEDVKGAQVFLNLAGENIAEKRWTHQRKEEILNSRVDATQKAALFCVQHRLTLFNASAVGIYGVQTPLTNRLPDPLDERSTILLDPKDFLATVCRKWEEATAPVRDKGCRVVRLRFGVIFDVKAGAFVKMLLPFKLFAGGPLGAGNQPVPWIALQDAVNVIDFLLEHPDIEGQVNLVSPGCLIQKELAKAIGKAYHRPGWVPAPAFVLKIILGEMAESLLLNGQFVHPKMLLDSGFDFQYNNIDDYLKTTAKGKVQP